MYIISLIYIIELSHKKQRYAIIHLPVQKKLMIFLYKKCRHTLLWRFVFVLSLFLNDEIEGDCIAGHYDTYVGDRKCTFD